MTVTRLFLVDSDIHPSEIPIGEFVRCLVMSYSTPQVRARHTPTDPVTAPMRRGGIGWPVVA